MITTRSLLPERLIAVCTEWNLQRLARIRLMRRKDRARLALIFRNGRLGRRRKPRVFALRTDVRRSFSDRAPRLPWQTTRTSPGPAPVTSDAKERAFGTLPPAGGVTELSGAGSGQ